MKSDATERAWRKWLLGYVRGRYRSTWLLVLREEWPQGFGQYSEHRKAFYAGVEHGRKGYAKLESRPMRVPDVSQEPPELGDAG